MAEALISGVVRNLAVIVGNLLAKICSPLFELEENINWIREEMSFVEALLEKADAVESESGGLADYDYIRSIWDLLYDLQDIREEYFPNLEGLVTRNDWKGWFSFSNAKTAHDFAVKVEEIKRRVVDMKRRIETHRVLDASGCPGKQRWDPRRTFPHTEEVNVVGMDEHIKELVAKVTDQDSVHRVISITGMPGVGKTTLARKAYNSVRRRFEYSAWIYVSRQPNPNELLHNIAKQVGLTDEECKQDLEGNLFRHLSQKRYVIVIDDIWKIEHWDTLINGIPVNSINIGSRLIITSRSKDICVRIGGQFFLHELQPLDEEKSRELFLKVVMAAPQDNDEDGDPSQLENIGEKILKKCGGVPLAIVVIAGVLLSRDRSIQAWKGVLESIGKDEDQCKKIFALSYKDLPSMLKPCFLYFSLFPEDHEISTFRLINLWAAERFIYGSGVRAVEDVGQDYLNQLVGRNLIQVIKRRLDGTVKLCRIHDILHDLCISKARETNFLNTLDNVATSAYSLAPRRVTTSFRRDAINYLSSNYQIPKLRAFLCFDDLRSIGMPDVKLRLRKFKSLRVLILPYITGPSSMNEIVKLKHLYHLELGWDDVIELPYAISNLENLLTLDLHKCLKLVLPDVIWKMKQLRHIRLPHNCWAPSIRGFHLDCHRFHPFEVSLPNLQTLFGLPIEVFEANWLHKLDSLRTLDIHFITEHIIEVMSSVNPLLQKLEELRILSFRHMKSALDLSRYISLRKLNMSCSGVMDFTRRDKLPTCLTVLILERTMLEMDSMVTLKKLPRLEILILGYASYLGEKMVCSGEAGSFPQLKVLRIFAESLEEFVAEEGAMPKLKDLTFTCRIPTVKVPDKIRNIIKIDPNIIVYDELDADP